MMLDLQNPTAAFKCLMVIFLSFFCSDVDATLLACVAFSIPNLETFELNMAENAVNRITGYGIDSYTWYLE